MRALALCIMAAVFAVAITTLSAFAQTDDLQLNFSQFPAEVYLGKPAPLQWDDAIADRRYFFRQYAMEEDTVDEVVQTIYREAADKLSQRFGGKYVVFITLCSQGIICPLMVDLTTGKIATGLPMAGTGYDFRPKSNLLVVNSVVPPVEEYKNYIDQATFYFEWKGGDWVLVGKEAWPERPVQTASDSIEQSVDISSLALPEIGPVPSAR